MYGDCKCPAGTKKVKEFILFGEVMCKKINLTCTGGKILFNSICICPAGKRYYNGNDI